MIKKISDYSFKWVSVIIFDITVILALVLYFAFQWSLQGIKIKGTYMTTPIALREFHLIDSRGRPISKEDFKGHWTMVFFGFTSCPVICPTTLAILNKMYQVLQNELPQHKLPQVVLISVDPEQDTIEKLNSFVHAFNPHFMGVRGPLEEILALEKQMHLPVSKSNPLSHSMEILLLNPDAHIQAYFSYPQQALQLAADYKLLIGLKPLKEAKQT